MKITCFAIGLHIASALKNIEFSVEYEEYKPKIFAQWSLHFISQNKAYDFAINYNHDKLWLIIIILHLEWSGVRQYKCARTMCKRLLYLQYTFADILAPVVKRRVIYLT